MFCPSKSFQYSGAAVALDPKPPTARCTVRTPLLMKAPSPCTLLYPRLWAPNTWDQVAYVKLYCCTVMDPVATVWVKNMSKVFDTVESKPAPAATPPLTGNEKIPLLPVLAVGEPTTAIEDQTPCPMMVALVELPIVRTVNSMS